MTHNSEHQEDREYKVETMRIITLLAISVLPSVMMADIKDCGIEMSVEASVTASNDKTPLWLNANRYGLSSLQDNGYLRISALRPNNLNRDRKWEWGYGADVALAYGNTNAFIIQQAYVDMRYKRGYLTIGSKQQKMELKNQELSSGSQTLGINSRPIPQVRLGLIDYWEIPRLNKWLAFKGHISFGVMTDGAWEEEFVRDSRNKYNKWSRYHEKAGYLRIGKEERFPLTLTLGLEMATQFGGYVYNWAGTDEKGNDQFEVKLNSGLSSYWHALTGTGSDTNESKYTNSEGNSLGSWVARLNWKAKSWEIGIYWDHFFEDHSSMFFLDYDGYGSGAEWDVKKDSRMFGYKMSDMLLGLDLRLNDFKPLNQFVVEYVNTRYQSSPIYHDHTQNISDHISGIDNYYNHHCLPGWQHYGQVMGNPLYLSPLYNDSRYIGTECNRFLAWHFGISGDPLAGLHYRAMVSWQRGWGRYDDPYLYPVENTSVLIEAAYQLKESGAKVVWKNMSVKCAWGADFGELRGNNNGWQLSVLYKL